MQREEPSVRRQRRAYSQRQMGKKSHMFTKIRDCDPYFDNYEWGCVSALVQLSLSKLNLKLNHVSLSEAFGMIQRTIHRYVVIPKLWTSCIS